MLDLKAQVRLTAEAGKYQSLISSEDLKVNELIVRANQRKARLKGFSSKQSYA